MSPTVAEETFIYDCTTAEYKQLSCYCTFRWLPNYPIRNNDVMNIFGDKAFGHIYLLSNFLEIKLLQQNSVYALNDLKNITKLSYKRSLVSSAFKSTSCPS